MIIKPGKENSLYNRYFNSHVLSGNHIHFVCTYYNPPHKTLHTLGNKVQVFRKYKYVFIESYLSYDTKKHRIHGH